MGCLFLKPQIRNEGHYLRPACKTVLEHLAGLWQALRNDLLVDSLGLERSVLSHLPCLRND